MSRGLVFWVLMLLWLILGVVGYVRVGAVDYMVLGGDLLEFVLFALLGWDTYGPAVHG